MSHWNHRVVRIMVKDFGKDVPQLGIHEAFYGMPEDDGVAWTNDPVPIIGKTVEELRETLKRMLACLDKPIIDGTKENVGR
jgi:hypothetical protein